MAFFSFGKKGGGPAAVSLLPERVDAARIRRQSSGRPEVLLLDSSRKEDSDAKTLGALRKRLGLGGSRCVTALRSGEYQILQIEAPVVADAELKEALRWRIKDMIDYPPESATVGVVTLPSGQAGAARGHSLYVFVARNEVIRERMTAFAEAKIALDAIDVPEMALRNIAALWAQPGRAAALLSFDEGGGMLVIVADGELCLSRRMDVTEMQLADTDEGRRQSQLERVGLELQRSFDHYDRQFGAVPLARLMVAAPAAQGLIEYLSGNLEVPVAALDLAQVMDFQGIPELRDHVRQAQCLIVLGLALRDETIAA